MKKLSLIISTYNRPDTLELVLLSLHDQEISNYRTDDIEVLVADDGSTIETKKLVEDYMDILPFMLKHVWHEDLGFRLAAIRNLAVKNASGEYLVFIDGDCIVPPDFIKNQLLLATTNHLVAGNRVLISESYTDEILKNKDITIVKPKIFNHVCKSISGQINKFSASLRLNPDSLWRMARGHNWKFPKGCNLALFRRDYLQVNGFDEAFTGWGHEDADFIIRLLHAGVKLKDGRFSVPVYHLWHKTVARSSDETNWQRLMQRLNDPHFIRADKGLN